MLDQVLGHVAADHGVADPALPFIELVMTHTRPFTPTDHRARLRVVDPDDPPGRVGAGPHPGTWLVKDAPVGAQPGQGRTASRSDVRPTNVHPLRPLDPSRPEPGGAHETYRHQCLFYAGTPGFLAAVVPFVRDGLARRETVMVAVAEPRLRALRSALGEDAGRVLLVDMAELGHNPARIIPAWWDFTDRFSGTGRPVRGVGEPIWATRRPEEIVEAQLHEALLNAAVPPHVPLWLLCPYDTAALDEDALTEAQRSHPVIVESGAHRGSTGYGGTGHAERLFGGPLPDPDPYRDQPITSVAFDPHRHGHIQQILRAASTAGLAMDRAVKLAAAVDEIARAAHRDTGRVTIRVWSDQAGVTGEVTDAGTVDDPMIGRGPFRGPRSPRDQAIRLANEFCDLAQVRSCGAGTTTRVHSRR